MRLHRPRFPNSDTSAKLDAGLNRIGVPVPFVHPYRPVTGHEAGAAAGLGPPLCGSMRWDRLRPMRPLCFILMPFGRKPDATGKMVDFDEVYRQVIKPAVDQAGFEPLRALSLIHI